MKFGMDMCKILFILREKMIDTDDIETPEGECKKQVKKDGYKYIGVIQDSQIKTAVMKEKTKKEYFPQVEKLSKSM